MAKSKTTGQPPPGGNDKALRIQAVSDGYDEALQALSSLMYDIMRAYGDSGPVFKTVEGIYLDLADAERKVVLP